MAVSTQHAEMYIKELPEIIEKITKFICKSLHLKAF